LETKIDDERKPIIIEVDCDDYKSDARVLTGIQIKTLAHRPPGNRLFRLDGHQRIEVADDEQVHLRNGERFVTQPPCGKAS
jgi:hypothetical protein